MELSGPSARGSGWCHPLRPALANCVGNGGEAEAPVRGPGGRGAASPRKGVAVDRWISGGPVSTAPADDIPLPSHPSFGRLLCPPCCGHPIWGAPEPRVTRTINPVMVAVIVLVALMVWMLGSILLGVLIGRAVRIADRDASIAAGRLRKSGLTVAA